MVHQATSGNHTYVCVCLWLRPSNPQDFGHSHQIGQGPCAHFFHGVAAVNLRGNLAHAQLRRYLFVHQASGREITQFVGDTETALLFHHSSRVYYWGALAGKHRGLKFDRELLYAGAMFHDMGLTPAHSSAHERFEVDGANADRDFLRSHGIDQHDIDRRAARTPAALLSSTPLLKLKWV